MGASDLGTLKKTSYNLEILFSLTMIDIDNSGDADLIVTSPFGEYSTIHTVKGTKNVGLCKSSELVLVNREQYFGWKVKSLPSSSNFYASSLFVASPGAARIEQFIQSDGYTVDIYPPNQRINIDPTVSERAVNVQYCVTLKQTPIVNAPFKFNMELGIEGDCLILETNNLLFTFHSIGETLCEAVIVILNYSQMNSSTANIHVLGTTLTLKFDFFIVFYD